MRLPFTSDQFYAVFRAYNTAVWPSQILLVALAVVAVVLVAVPRRGSGVAVSAILAILWGWTGVAYHAVFFADINPLAYGFAALSVLGALAFVWQGVVRRRLEFRLTASVRTAVGLLLVVFALVVYPVWSIYGGLRYPELPTFGLPCPTTIFTIGILSLAVRPTPRLPLVVPVLWSFVGGQAAFLLGVPQDLGLLVAGLVGVALILRSSSGSSERTASPHVASERSVVRVSSVSSQW